MACIASKANLKAAREHFADGRKIEQAFHEVRVIRDAVDNLNLHTFNFIGA